MTYLPPANGGRVNVTIGGNTAGAGALVSSGTMTLVGGNNVTLFQNDNAIFVSAGNQTVQTQNVHNVTLDGNTAGVMAQISSGTMTLAGGNNITLSQNGNAVTIAGAGGAAMTLSRYQNMDRGTSTLLAPPFGVPFLQRLNQENDLFAGNMTANTVLFNFSGSSSSSNHTLAAHTLSLLVGIYQPVATANTVLTLVNSASISFGSNATMSVVPYYQGNRWMSIHSSQWSSPPAFTQGGDYVFGVLFRSSGTRLASLSMVGQNYMNTNVRSGFIGVSSTTGNVTLPHGNYWNAMLGSASSGTYTALPTAISGDQVTRANATAVFIPHVILNNQYTY